MAIMNDENRHDGILLYAAFLVTRASLQKQKEMAALISQSRRFIGA